MVMTMTGVPPPLIHQVVHFNHGVHFDPAEFPDPDRFVADRFLDPETGRFVGPDDRVLAFSTGKRKCVGEVLARAELFLFVASIVQVSSTGVEPLQILYDMLVCCMVHYLQVVMDSKRGQM